MASNQQRSLNDEEISHLLLQESDESDIGEDMVESDVHRSDIYGEDGDSDDE